MTELENISHQILLLIDIMPSKTSARNPHQDNTLSSQGVAFNSDKSWLAHVGFQLPLGFDHTLLQSLPIDLDVAQVVCNKN